MKFNRWKVKELVEKSELKRPVIAKRVGLKDKSFLNALNGYTGISVAAIRLLSQTLGVPEEELYLKDDTGPEAA